MRWLYLSFLLMGAAPAILEVYGRRHRLALWEYYGQQAGATLPSLTRVLRLLPGRRLPLCELFFLSDQLPLRSGMMRTERFHQAATAQRVFEPSAGAEEDSGVGC